MKQTFELSGAPSLTVQPRDVAAGHVLQPEDEARIVAALRADLALNHPAFGDLAVSCSCHAGCSTDTPCEFCTEERETYYEAATGAE